MKVERDDYSELTKVMYLVMHCVCMYVTDLVRCKIDGF